MTVLAALSDGIRRVNRAPAILIAVWVLTVAVSLPLALGLRGMLVQHLGNSLAADSALGGVNYDWMQEFGDQAAGLGVTFKPTIIGFAAVLDNLSGFLDNTPRPVVVVGAAAAYIVLWIFLAGGIIDRYARERPTRAHGFFSACGVYFFRFARLAVVMWIVYAVLFRYVHAWIFDELYTRLTDELAVERTAFFIRVGLYALFGLLVAACNLVFDYAKVRAVVEDRRSMIGAVGASARFIRRNLAAATGLYVADFALFLVAIWLYSLVAPGVGGGGIQIWTAVVIGQAYIALRLWVKLVFWASETAFFQGRFAHAGYVGGPVAEWPESPAAEGILRS